jgi:hypothetical protein
MNTKSILSVLLFLVSLKAFSTIELNCYQPTGSQGTPGSQLLQGAPGSQGLVRTFKPKTIPRPSEHINFNAALFSITKSSVGVMSNAPFYSLYFDGNIDITPGGNKFWDLAGNAEIIDEIDNHIGVDAQTISGFKDCNYYKKVFLSVLGQSITAHEYYYLDDSKIYAKGMSISMQTVNGSGITINVPEQEVLYAPSKPVCYFPLTYDETTHTIPQYTRTINATLSGASGLGIPDGTTVSYSVTFNDNYKVLAWGGLQLIDNENPVNALLVQTESRTVETILINGAKVPQSVLSPLKITQDFASVSVNYSFRNMTYPDNIAEFGLDGDKVTYLTTIKTIK